MSSSDQKWPNVVSPKWLVHLEKIHQAGLLYKGKSFKLISLIWHHWGNLESVDVQSVFGCLKSLNVNKSLDESKSFWQWIKWICGIFQLRNTRPPQIRRRIVRKSKEEVTTEIFGFPEIVAPKGGQRSEPEGTTLLSLQLFVEGQEPSLLTLVNYWQHRISSSLQRMLDRLFSFLASFD